MLTITGLPPGPSAQVPSATFPVSSLRLACFYFGTELPTRLLCFSLPPGGGGHGARYFCIGSGSRKTSGSPEHLSSLWRVIRSGTNVDTLVLCVYFFNICELGTVSPAEAPILQSEPTPFSDRWKTWLFPQSQLLVRFTLLQSQQPPDAQARGDWRGGPSSE